MYVEAVTPSMLPNVLYIIGKGDLVPNMFYIIGEGDLGAVYMFLSLS